MRPYLAILKDSFREALASRVLLIAIAAIIVVLLLLAPFGLHYEKATELRRGEIRNSERLLRQLLEDDKSGAVVHIRSLLSEKQRERAEQLLNPDPEQEMPRRRGPGSPLLRELVNQLNALLDHPDFYGADAWSGINVGEEAESLNALSDQRSLSELERRRRNLLMLIAAFPRTIRVTDSQAISLTYANASVVESIPLTPTQFEPIFDRILTEVITVFLGFFGVFASLLVTAGIIPRTFEPGEISLLLSKPINRSALFVTKFIGGCTFTLLYSTVLIVGVWFLLGTRMGFWRPELMWCIPVYVFLFMIYFAVSAVAGAIWRNSIVALSLVVVFWLSITVTEVSKDSMEEHLMDDNGIHDIVVAGNDIVTVDGKQRTRIWNSTENVWSEIYRQPAGSGLGSFAQRFLGNVKFQPVYDRTGDRLLVLQQTPSRFQGAGAPQLMAGYKTDDWERIPLGRLPDSCNDILFTSGGDLIFPTVSGLYQYIDPANDSQPAAAGGILNTLTGGLFGGPKNFKQIQVDGYPELDPNYACDLNPQDNSIWFLSNGALTSFRAEGDTYKKSAELDIDTDGPGLISAHGQRVLLALSDGRIILLNADTLDPTLETRLPESVLPKRCIASPTGSLIALLTHEDTVLLFDSSADQQVDWTVPENGECSAVAYSEDGHLLVSDGRRAVREYDLEAKQVANAWEEEESWVYDLYDFGLNPLHLVLPKPSQLDDFVPYVMTGDKAMIAGERDGPPILNRESLQRDRKVFDAWQVIRDNAAFIVVILSLGCFIISRRDF